VAASVAAEGVPSPVIWWPAALNYTISQCGEGEEIACADLALIMLRLQEAGCHNINLVSPTHYLPQILRALVTAAEWGLAIPLVYNTGGYDRAETIALLDGIVDIYDQIRQSAPHFSGEVNAVHR